MDSLALAAAIPNLFSVCCEENKEGKLLIFSLMRLKVKVSKNGNFIKIVKKSEKKIRYTSNQKQIIDKCN